MKHYPKYKSSEIEWLEEIPTGWDEISIGHLGNLINGVNKPKEAYGHGFRFVTVNNLYGNGQIDQKKLGRVEVSDVELERFKLNEHDILMARSSVKPDGVGHPAIIKDIQENTVFAGFVIRFRVQSEKAFKPYMLWILISSAVRGMVVASANTVAQTNITQTALKSIKLPLPPIPEQEKIVTYLDHKTAKIDSLIEKKKRLIELLKEERTAVINQAVTKGLDPNVLMKDSGIEWLGEIPEHWEVVPLTKYLASIVDYRGRTPKKVSDGIFLVTAKNIKNGIIDYTLSEEFVDLVDVQSLLNRGRPKVGDVLFTTEAPLGEVANIDREDIALAQRVIKFRGKQNTLNNFFLKFWMLSSMFQQDLQSFATGSTALGIKASKLNYLRLVLSPIDDQLSVVKFIEKENTRIDAVISKSEKEIELLQEYRTALISEVVTGKIDVREEKV